MDVSTRWTVLILQASSTCLILLKIQFEWPVVMVWNPSRKQSSSTFSMTLFWLSKAISDETSSCVLSISIWVYYASKFRKGTRKIKTTFTLPTFWTCSLVFYSSNNWCFKKLYSCSISNWPALSLRMLESTKLTPTIH